MRVQRWWHPHCANLIATRVGKAKRVHLHPRVDRWSTAQARLCSMHHSHPPTPRSKRSRRGRQQPRAPCRALDAPCMVAIALVENIWRRPWLSTCVMFSASNPADPAWRSVVKRTPCRTAPVPPGQWTLLGKENCPTSPSATACRPARHAVADPQFRAASSWRRTGAPPSLPSKKRKPTPLSPGRGVIGEAGVSAKGFPRPGHAASPCDHEGLPSARTAGRQRHTPLRRPAEPQRTNVAGSGWPSPAARRDRRSLR